jgi:hypothetical protein
MNSKSYIKSVFLFVVVLLTAAALTNFLVDPGNIYPKYLSQEKITTPEVFVKKLINSRYGLLIPKNIWNERDIKKALAEYPINYDCAVIGSSRIMQISSTRQNKSLTSNCSNIRNLGVSGGTLEDYLAMSSIILKNSEYLPKTIVFGIDPWALNLGKDKRWARYGQEYFEMKDELLNKYPSTQLNHDNNSTGKDLLKNLFNLQYLDRSLGIILKPEMGVTTAPKIDYDIGFSQPVMLPDGSLIYSSKYIINAKKNNNIYGKYNYKTNRKKTYQLSALELFTKLIVHFKNKGINIIFMLVPYHYDTWSIKNQLTVESMLLVEQKVYELSQQLKVPLIGSYNPSIVGCSGNDFFDAMHPKDRCLKKIIK